jgi:hypothetical protein
MHFDRRSTILTGSTILTACIVLASQQSAMSQGQKSAPKPDTKIQHATPAETEEPKQFVRVYPIDDLLFIRNDYPFQTTLPTTRPLSPNERVSPSQTFRGGGVGGGFGGGGMGGGGFGGGGMGGGGMFSLDGKQTGQILRQFGGGSPSSSVTNSPTANAANTPQVSAQALSPGARLIDLLTTLGPGGDTDQYFIFGMNLVAKQTEDGHRQIAELLKALRSGSSATHSVTVEATWMICDPAQRDAVGSAATRLQNLVGSHTADAKQFRDLTAKMTAFHGQITCMSGQKVHLATGGRRVISSSAQPTVGVGAIGYTPIINNVNVGAVLEVTPTVTGNRQVYLDLHSVVTEWGKQPEPVRVSSHSLSGTTPSSTTSGGKLEGPLTSESILLDRVNLGTQEWSTTASIPLGVPVLIGSVTLTNPDDNGATLQASDRPDLTLIVEVRAD